MLRALWWFRMAAVVTVLVGFGYWQMSRIRRAQWRRGFRTNHGKLFRHLDGSLGDSLRLPDSRQRRARQRSVLAVIYALVVASGVSFLDINDHGWESNRTLAIGIGGGIGWVMMLNVWGVIWRIQKKMIQWTKDSAENGTPMPEKSKRMARMAFLCSRANALLSIPLLFFMAAASHYPMFGR